MSLMDMLMDQPSGFDKLSMLQSLSGSTRPRPESMGAPMSGGPMGWINEAMDITNTPDKFRDELHELMMRESGGNPREYNDTPVASGQHAQGLFQTIPSTFKAHRMQGLGGINDPVANAVAAIRYIYGRYGNPGNLPTSGGY